MVIRVTGLHVRVVVGGLPLVPVGTGALPRSICIVQEHGNTRVLVLSITMKGIKIIATYSIRLPVLF